MAEPMSRRTALKIVSAITVGGLVAAGGLLRNKQPKDEVTGVEEGGKQPTAAIPTPEVTARDEAMERADSDRDKEEKLLERILTPEMIDEIEVYGANQAWGKEEFEAWGKDKTVSLKNPDYRKRTAEILIDSVFWERWQREGIRDGETFVQFEKRHVKTFNELIARTRESSGIRDIQVDTFKILVLEREYLRSLYGPTQGVPDDYSHAWVRWGYTAANYGDDFLQGSVPTVDPRDGKFTDDVLFHEWKHYWLYVWPHLNNYFLPLSNWKEYLETSEELKQKQLGLWKWKGLEPQFAPDRYFSQHWYEDGSLISEPSELMIRRAFQKPSTIFPYRYYSDRERCEGEWAPKYEFLSGSGGGGDAKLYVSRCSQADDADNIHWRFDGEPEVLPVVAGKIELRKVILKRKAGKGTDTDEGAKDSVQRAYLLVIGDRIYGFTDYHLYFWNYKNQLAMGEQFIGSDGGQHEVVVNTADFELMS